MSDKCFLEITNPHFHLISSYNNGVASSYSKHNLIRLLTRRKRVFVYLSHFHYSATNQHLFHFTTIENISWMIFTNDTLYVQRLLLNVLPNNNNIMCSILATSQIRRAFTFSHLDLLIFHIIKSFPNKDR